MDAWAVEVDSKMLAELRAELHKMRDEDSRIQIDSTNIHLDKILRIAYLFDLKTVPVPVDILDVAIKLLNNTPDASH